MPVNCKSTAASEREQKAQKARGGTFFLTAMIDKAVEPDLCSIDGCGVGRSRDKFSPEGWYPHAYSYTTLKASTERVRDRRREQPLCVTRRDRERTHPEGLKSKLPFKSLI